MEQQTRNTNIWKYTVIACCVVALLVTMFSLLLKPKNVTIDKKTIMMSSTKTTEKSEFDIWLTDNLGVKWVPCYVIVDGHEIIGIIDGGFGLQSFKEQFDEIMQKHEVIMDIRAVENTLVYLPLIDGMTDLADMLNDDRLNIIEVHKLECQDCKIADGIPGEYTIYTEFNDDGTPVLDSETKLVIDGKQLNETSQIRHAVKNATFYRYYIRSSAQSIVDRYTQK